MPRVKGPELFDSYLLKGGILKGWEPQVAPVTVSGFLDFGVIRAIDEMDFSHTIIVLVFWFRLFGRTRQAILPRNVPDYAL